MNAETIKDFLISLGFSVDDAGARKFEATLTGATIKAVQMGAAVEAAALSVVAFTAKIADGLDKLYWASQRTGATVQGIKSLSYAVSQVGGSAEAARGSLESLAHFVRNNPGSEGFLNRLGVQTRDASGRMRDMSAIFTGVGQKLSSMPYYRANQYAQMLGIDENTLMAMRRGIGQFSGQYSAMAKAIGFNADQAAVSSNKFMTSLRSFGEMAGMARDKIGSGLAEGLAGSMDDLRKRILDNFPSIEKIIMRVIKGVLTFADIFTRVTYRIIQAVGDIKSWWDGLSDSGKQMIEVLGAVVVAWRLLNAAFMATPIGLITTAVLALGVGILALYDDFKTWKEGGQSLIDWGKWKPAIDYAMKAFGGLGDGILDVYDKAKELGGAILDAGEQLLKFVNIDTSKFSGKWLFDQIIDSAKNAMKVLGAMVDAIKKIIQGDFSGAFSSLKDAAVTLTQGPVAQGVTSLVQGAWDKVTDYLDPDEPEQHAQAAKRGERNNNPGNLNFAGQSGASLEHPGGRFARFESSFDGLRALSRQLMLYAGRGINSVEKIISTWAPASDNNNTAAYIQAVSQKLGVNPQMALNMSDPRTMSALMSSIISHENGRNIYSRDLIGKAAVAGMGGSLNQQTVINVHGVSSPQEAANLIADKQGTVNSRAAQQLNKRPS